MTCSRRPGAVWTLCRCQPCLTSNARLAKRYRSGHALVRGRSAAWERVAIWQARGWSLQIVVDLTGLSDDTVNHMYRAVESGRRFRILQETVRKILTAPDAPTGNGRIPATGTLRRLRALTVMGWSMHDVAARYDSDPSTLSTIRSGRLPMVTGRSAQVVAVAYDELWNRRGPSRLAGTRAKNRGWHGPLAWDDETIDDPSSEPNIGEATFVPTGGSGRPGEVTAEDVAFLLEHDAALTTQAAAHRLRLDPRSLVRALERAGRTDLRDRLTRNTKSAAA